MNYFVKNSKENFAINLNKLWSLLVFLWVCMIRQIFQIVPATEIRFDVFAFIIIFFLSTTIGFVK